MLTLRFHKELYDGFVLDAAMRTYAAVASFERAEVGEYYEVRLTSSGRHPEQRIADELGNYALGASIEERTSSVRDAAYSANTKSPGAGE